MGSTHHKALLTMILVGIKFYITVGFLSIILHAIKCTQVVNTYYETLICEQQNKVEMKACRNRLYQIKTITMMCVLGPTTLLGVMCPFTSLFYS
jgi:hypothetical protein